MPTYKEAGGVSVKGGYEIEWTIPNIFSYTMENEWYISPSFDASCSSWYLYFHLSSADGWMYLYLCRGKDSPPSQSANFNFGVKRADGTVEDSGLDRTWVFDVKHCGYGYGQLKLLQMSELAPSDALTVTCSLRVYEGGPHSPASTDTLSQDLLDMFTSNRGCDATLKVKTKEFTVHKCILAARSPVFAAMFEVDMREKQTGVVDILDCDPEAFKEFLAYLYSGKVDNLASNAFELFKIADKYGVKGLKPACLVSIMNNLSLKNVCDAVLLGHRFSVHEIKMKSNRFFNENFGEIFSTAQWKSFLKSNCDLANELLIGMASEMKSKKK